jgi:hypothetical protein
MTRLDAAVGGVMGLRREFGGEGKNWWGTLWG